MPTGTEDGAADDGVGVTGVSGGRVAQRGAMATSVGDGAATLGAPAAASTMPVSLMSPSRTRLLRRVRPHLLRVVPCPLSCSGGHLLHHYAHL
jgi:hypothetical protein